MNTQKYINDIAYKIVGCAIEVHKQLGPGLLESVYEECLIEEMNNNGLFVKKQIAIPIIYKGKELATPLKLDVIVNELVIVEIKSVEVLLPVFKAQLLTYLKLTGKPKGLLINFNCENISKELIPLVTEEFAKYPKS
ncbi:MAG TPA: GxxExxY protein [Bacteroidia bacterium]|nr:GxxExxY protein [Bacteroidia bacterium]